MAGRGVVLVSLACLAGCSAEPAKQAVPARAAGPDLDAELARARAEKKSVLVVVTEERKSPGDAAAHALLADATVRARAEKWITVDLDVNVSRSRAAATRFHLASTPLILCLSPQGIVVSRDDTREEKTLSNEFVLSRMGKAELVGPALDEELAQLEAAAGVDARMKLAEFLVAHQNAREAIPHLEAVRRSEGADVPLRARAAVEEVRAHYWIGEPEKARHVAEELIATLGATSADARAAGYFALGAQDVTGRHKDLGLRELDEAIAAAPGSIYGKQAAELRAELGATK